MHTSTIFSICTNIL